MNKRKPHQYQYISDVEDREITKLLQSLIDGQAKEIAFAIGCDYQDMLNRVSNQPRSPRKLELVLKILDHVEDPEPFVRWINARYGYVPPIRKPLVQRPTDSLFQQITRIGKELGDVSREVLESLKDDLIDIQELARVNKEILDVVQRSYELDLAIQYETDLGD